MQVTPQPTALLLCAALLIAGCIPKAPPVQRCPAVAPVIEDCEPCKSEPLPEIKTIEDLKRSVLMERKAKLECEERADACYRLARLWANVWADCGEYS